MGDALLPIFSTAGANPYSLFFLGGQYPCHGPGTGNGGHGFDPENVKFPGFGNPGPQLPPTKIGETHHE